MKLVKVGQGRYSSVYAGDIDGNGSVRAFKEVRVSLANSPVANAALKAALRELLALRAIGYHENIVQLSGYSVSHGSVVFTLQYCEWDIDKLLHHCDSHLPIDIIHDMTYQLFNGLSVIHETGLLHRDIKPSNILISKATGLLKIADFGLSRPMGKLTSETQATREVCTRWYKAIEILLGGGQGDGKGDGAMDVWSAGLVVAELLNHCPLFPGISDINQVFLIFQSLGEPNLTDWPEYAFLPESRKLPFAGNFLSWEILVPRASGIFMKILPGCMRYNPKLRLTAQECRDLEISSRPFLIADWLTRI